MYFNGFTLLCIFVAGTSLFAVLYLLWQIRILKHDYNQAIEVGADLLNELEALKTQTCCNCGNDNGPYPVCIDCLMKIAGVAPTEMSLSEIVTELDRVVPELPPQRSAEWERLMRGVNGG